MDKKRLKRWRFRTRLSKCKIIVDKECLQVKTLKIPGFQVSYDNDKDFEQKLMKFAQTTGILTFLNQNWSRNLQ
jgi:hypothetical protein